MHVTRKRWRVVAGTVVALGAVAVATTSVASAHTTAKCREPVRALRQHHDHDDLGGQPGSWPRARHQDARLAVREEVPEREGESHVQGLHGLHEGHPALAERQLGAGRLRGQPELRDGRAARQGEADHPARQVRDAVRLEQALLARRGAAVPLVARRQGVRQGQPVRRRPVRSVDGPVLQQGQADQVRRQPEQDADDVHGLRERC